MTEKKTFKNVLVEPSNSRPGGWFVEAPEGEERHYSPQEWDMEVTFTRKPGPVEVGQWRVMGKTGEESCVYILAIYGLVAWVTDDPEWLSDGRLNAWTEPLVNIR